jgi:hypothetical protein
MTNETPEAIEKRLEKIENSDKQALGLIVAFVSLILVSCICLTLIPTL